MRQRRHRPGDVLSEQRDEGFDVALFERGGVAGDNLPQPRVVDLLQRLAAVNSALARARRIVAEKVPSPTQQARVGAAGPLPTSALG